MEDIKNMLKQSVNEDGLREILEDMDREINFNALLDKYGPEGLYMIADRLKELADEDMEDTINSPFL